MMNVSMNQATGIDDQLLTMVVQVTGFNEPSTVTVNEWGSDIYK